MKFLSQLQIFLSYVSLDETQLSKSSTMLPHTAIHGRMKVLRNDFAFH